MIYNRLVPEGYDKYHGGMKMMYVIKTVYEATEKNDNFKGETQTWYSGRKETNLSRDTFPTQGQVDEFGYKNLSGAMRGLKAAQETADWCNARGFWKVSVSLVRA